MLYYSTVEPSTLELLRKLMESAVFDQLRLVGGTALSLQYGHRKSIDLDLFGLIHSDEDEILYALKKIGTVEVLKKSKNINIYLLDGIKVVLIHYSYLWIEEIQDRDGIRMAHPKDIAAMKISAITGRGTKKDFYDLYELLNHYTLDNIFQCYQQKYSDASVFLMLKSIVYFEDAENDPEPVLLSKASWNLVKKKITYEFNEYLNNH